MCFRVHRSLLVFDREAAAFFHYDSAGRDRGEGVMGFGWFVGLLVVGWLVVDLFAGSLPQNPTPTPIPTTALCAGTTNAATARKLAKKLTPVFMGADGGSRTCVFATPPPPSYTHTHTHTHIHTHTPPPPPPPPPPRHPPHSMTMGAGKARGRHDALELSHAACCPRRCSL